MISLNDPLGGGPEQDPVPAPATGKKTSIKPLDTANHFEVVGTSHGSVSIVNAPLPHQVFSRAEALNLAAWLFVSAAAKDGPVKTLEEFRAIVEDIRKP